MGHEDFTGYSAEQQGASPEQLLAGLVERRALSYPLDGTDYESSLLGCNRDFRMPDGGKLAISGLFDLYSQRLFDGGQWFSWTLDIKPFHPYVVSAHGEISPPKSNASHQFHIDLDASGGPTQVFQEGSNIPLSPHAVEGLLATVANSVPLGETEYRIWQDRRMVTI